jgi:hypothetical protein
MEEHPIYCEWHAIDIAGGEAYVWAFTKEDAIQEANAIPGMVQVEYCERVKDEKPT